MTEHDSQEIKQLLREIRDLQQAHFDRYVAFTDQVLQSQSRTENETVRAQAEHEAWQREQLALQQEIRGAVRASQRNAIVAVLVILLLVVTYVLAQIVLPQIVLPDAVVDP